MMMVGWYVPITGMGEKVREGEGNERPHLNVNDQCEWKEYLFVDMIRVNRGNDHGWMACAYNRTKENVRGRQGNEYFFNDMNDHYEWRD